ncbi:Signal transduction histidine-protein kinase BarA [Posidoniimonas polymericola]|uniref:Sensory/regulatory protein RpfC n=1 Tax=Posidoniimonas polymericola TaxID=2528002 RepID=A0A5C5YQ02_9BACT|nr:response regulator [Posidoniimonas polymericola]TWT76985.1 Signal transduction histidine-protein kinase BarA [Posidoniimonas polymericola]
MSAPSSIAGCGVTVDMLPIGVLVFDRDFRVHEWNAVLEDWTGLSREKVIGLSLKEHYPNLAEPALRARLDQVFDQGASVVLSSALHRSFLPVRRAGDALMPQRTSIRPLPDNRTLALAVIEDQTHSFKQLEELRAARRRSQAASMAKSEFLANMSHEIRTPMNSIIGLTGVVLDGELGAVQRDYLQTVACSAESLLAIIDDILDFSKIEAGKLRLSAEPFDLYEVLGATLKSLALSAEQSDLEVLLRVDPRTPERLSGDSARLRQVLVNLIGNSLKFTRQGQVLLEVAPADAADAPEGQIDLHFHLLDSGVGIAREKLSMIFEAFEQADTSSARQFGGTGLGLPISKRLVEQMHGRMWVESQVGVGSSFHFTARLGELEHAPQAGVPLADQRLLVVCGHPILRELVVEELSRHGAEVREASDLASAEELINQQASSGRYFSGAAFDSHVLQASPPDSLRLLEGLSAHRAVVAMLAPPSVSAATMGLESLQHVTRVSKPVLPRQLVAAFCPSTEQADDDASSPNLVGHEGVTGGTNQPRRLRVLLAEDSLPNQKLAIALLAREGHECVVAENGAQAVAALEFNAAGFDVALMDIQMPEMDGLTATSVIREREAATGASRIPIVAMTAHALKGDRAMCLDAGMDDYVTKPVRREALLSVLERVTSPAAAAFL